jgi:hypothetical protein
MMPIPDIPANVREVVNECVTRFGDNLACALWHGSRARGEPTAASDEDLILVFHRIGDDVLLGLREVFLRPHLHDWSTYTLAVDELRQYPRNNRLQFHYGFRAVHGELDPPPFTRNDLLADLRALATEIRSYCRHYFIHHDFPHPHPDTVRTARMMYYMAKNSVRAMQIRHLHRTGEFPLTRSELQDVVHDPEDAAIMDIVERWPELKPAYEKDPCPLILQLDAFARRLVESLPEA